MTSPNDQERASAASFALADIERQQAFVTQRLGGLARLTPVVAVVLALSAASLAHRNDALFVVVQVVYLAAFIPLVGTPVRSGVLPREGRRSLRLVFALGLVLVSVPPLAMLGPWWTAIVAGGGAGVAVVVLSRWRRTAIVREAHSLAGVDDNRQGALAGRIAAAPAVIVIAVLCVGALTAASPDRVIRSAGTLAYFLGLGVLLVTTQRIGVLPPGLRVGLFRKAMFLAVALIIPVMMTMFFTSLRGNWWVAGCCALTAMLASATVLRWQRHILRDQARAASPPTPDSANG
jgi:hypothetical protein